MKRSHLSPLFFFLGLLALCTAWGSAVQVQGQEWAGLPEFSSPSVPAEFQVLETGQPAGAVEAVREKVTLSSVKVYKNGKKQKVKLTGRYTDASISANAGETIFMILKGKYSGVKGVNGIIYVYSTESDEILYFGPALSRRTVTGTCAKTFSAPTSDTWYIVVAGPPTANSPSIIKRLHITVSAGGP